MAQYSWPWSGETTGDCGPYSASVEADWHYYLSMTSMSGEGVMLSDGSFDENLNCTGSTSPITAHTGRAMVRGHLYRNSSDTNFTVSTPSSATRKDLLVLQCDWVAQTIRLVKLTGAEGGGDPSLTQIDGTKWEIALWRITITTGGAITLTDLRSYCHFRTKVSTAMLDDGVLSADAPGRLKIADGYFAATSEMRAKFANGFVTAALCDPSASPIFGWVHYNAGTSTVERSYGVSGVANQGGGVYRVTWSTARSSANYVVLAKAGKSYGSPTYYIKTFIESITTTYVDIKCAGDGSGSNDPSHLCVAGVDN